MGLITPKLALRIGGAITSLGIVLMLLDPFGRGAAPDLTQGLVIGVGFGMTIAGLVKGRRRPLPGR